MKEMEIVEGTSKLDLMFDALLVQTIKIEISYEEFVEINARDEFYGEFEQLGSWRQQFGYKFSVYNDHLIDEQKHFHFDNSEKNIHLKMDFDGNILEDNGRNRIDKKVHKILKKFLQQPSVVAEWNVLWNKNNHEA
jgi:hypothetical protein